MEDIKNKLTNEEIEIIRCVLLERSTFYTKKITDGRFLLLKLRPEEEIFRKNYEEQVDFAFKYKKAIDKLHDNLKYN